MAIPADDPRLAPVIIERDEVKVQPLERDEEGRLIFSEDVDVATFVSLQPFQQQFDIEAAQNVLDTGISNLTTEDSGNAQETQTTTITDAG